MLKRQKLKRWNKEGYVGIDDFKMGEEFHFLGRVVKICGCDDFTREYYERIEKPLVGRM